MTSERKPPGPKKIRTRKLILDRAGDLFARQGVHGTTMEQIGEATGLTVGALYTHFGSKQELALAFVGDGLEVIEELLAQARTFESPLDRVCAAGDAYFRWSVEQPIAARFAAVRVLQPDPGPEYARIHEAFSARVHVLILGIAEDAKAAMTAGEISPVPLDELMIFLWGAWNGVSALMLRQDGLAIAPEAGKRALELGRSMIRAASTQAAAAAAAATASSAGGLSAPAAGCEAPYGRAA